jgi:hypothetical protein
MSNTATVLLALVIVTWMLLFGVWSSVIGVDDTGDRDIFAGLRWIFAGVLICALWGWLAGLLLTAGGEGLLPPWVGFAAAILVPASAASAFAGLYLSSQLAARWPMAIAMAVPPLIAGYVGLLYLPSLRAMATSPVWSGAVWGGVLALSMVLWPSVSRRVAANDARRTEAQKVRDAAQVQQDETKRTANLAKLKSMRPEQPLRDWLPLLEPDSGVRADAFAVLRTIDRRQRDVEEGLNQGFQWPMDLVPDLDLRCTPELCQSARTFLKKTADDFHIADGISHEYQTNIYLEASLRGVTWFNAHGCQCDQEVAAIETNVRAWADTPDRRQLLNLLAGLKKGRKP